MVKTTTLDSFQSSLSDTTEAEAEPVQVSNPLAALAERMVAERSAPTQPDDPFAGMELDIEPEDAWGLVQGKVRAWLEDRGIFAQEDEIRAKTNDLWGAAQSTAPRVVEATYTVGPDGLVDGYQRTVTTITDSEGNSAELDTPEGRAIITRSVAKALGVPASELPDMPQKPLKVASDSVFDDDGWADSTALAARARLLIERHPDELDHLRGMSLVYLWRQKGGKSYGRPVFGRCEKLSGLKKHFAGGEFAVWLAADNIRAANFGDREIEALLFRQLLHAGVSEVDENTGRGGGPTYVPHDVMVFNAELRVYGLWEASLKAAAPAFKQASLFDAQPVVDEIDDELDREEAARSGYVENPLSGAGQLIHPDGTPLSAEEIAEMEAAESRDDDYLDDDEEELEERRPREPFMGAEDDEEAELPGEVAIAADDRRKWGPDA